MLTAVAKDEAIAQADAGKLQTGRRNSWPSKIICSKRSSANAPAAVQVQIRAETNNLGNFNDQLVNGSYDGASRKSLQSQSYNTRNSK